MKVCQICKKKIKAKDNYCKLTDYKEGEFFYEGFYHALCYRDQIKGLNPDQLAMKKMAIGMLGKAKHLLGELGLEKKEYQIK